MKYTVAIEIIPRRDIQLAVEDAAEIIFADPNGISNFPAGDGTRVILV